MDFFISILYPKAVFIAGEGTIAPRYTAQCDMCHLVLWQVSGHPTCSPPEGCGWNVFSKLQQYDEELIFTSAHHQEKEGGAALKGLEEDSGDPPSSEAVCWSRLETAEVPGPQGHCLGQWEESWGGMTLGAKGTEHGNEICVIRWHTLQPRPEPKSITALQDKTRLHLLFLVTLLEERPQPEHLPENLSVAVLLSRLCQGGGWSDHAPWHAQKSFRLLMPVCQK